MADIFKFGGFLKAINKKREQAAESSSAPAKPEEGSQSTTQTGTVQPTMSQADFLYGTEGMRRKRKE